MQITFDRQQDLLTITSTTVGSITITITSTSTTTMGTGAANMGNQGMVSAIDSI